MIWPVSCLGNDQCHSSISQKLFPLSTIQKTVELSMIRLRGGEICSVGNFIGEISAPRKLGKMCMSDQQTDKAGTRVACPLLKMR